MLLHYDAPDNKYVINNDIFLLLEVTTRTRDENTGKNTTLTTVPPVSVVLLSLPDDDKTQTTLLLLLPPANWITDIPSRGIQTLWVVIRVSIPLAAGDPRSCRAADQQLRLAMLCRVEGPLGGIWRIRRPALRRRRCENQGLLNDILGLGFPK